MLVSLLVMVLVLLSCSNKPKFNYAELSFLTQLGLQLSLFLAWSGLVWPVLAWYDLF